MPPCPTNSTDCLLRQLIQASSRDTWDPLNFAFTAVLGILAVLVAIFTLVQALLAAGPGRLKASKAAIGPHFGRSAKTRFSWTELRMRTTVTVPELDVDQALKNDFRDPGQRQASQVVLTGAKLEAGWVKWLQDTGLDALMWRQTTCVTENLPGDVYAAPATATIELLALLTAMEGEIRFDNKKRPRFMHGKRSQVILREHPSLGLIAQHQHTQGSLRRKLFSINSVRGALFHAGGAVTYRRKALVGFQLPSSAAKSLNLDMKELEASIESQYRGCSHQSCFFRNQAVPSWHGFGEKHTSWDLSTMTMLLFGDQPSPVLLAPSKGMATRATLSNILRRLGTDWDSKELILGAFQDACADEKSLQTFQANESVGRISMSGLWSQLEERHVHPTSSPSSWVKELHKQYGQGSKVSCSWFDDESTPLTPPLHGSFSLHPSETFLGSKRVVGECNLIPEDGDLLIFEPNVSTSIDFLNDDDMHEELDEESRSRRCRWVSWQLAQVDWWLKHHGGHSALCSALNMITKLVGSGQHLLEGPGQQTSYSRDLVRRTGIRREQTFASRDGWIEPETAITGLELVHIPKTISNPRRVNTDASGYREVPGEHERRRPLNGPPTSARMTKISRQLVNPQALSEADEDFEETNDYVIVKRVLERDEIYQLAMRTWDIRRNYMEAGNGLDQIRSVDPRLVGQSQNEGARQDHAEQQSHDHTEEMAMIPYIPPKRPEEASSTRHSSAFSFSSQYRPGVTNQRSVPRPPLLLTENSRGSPTRVIKDLQEGDVRPQYPTNIPPAAPLQTSQGAVIAEDQKLEGLEAVLIFRMILYAMLLETAVDTSDILAMEERDRYVYVL